ncbi:hypothetical protein GS643_06480 [Xanthomonas hortorum pv. gardneri]
MAVALLKACLLIALRCEADQTRSYPNNARHALLATMHTDQLDGSLPAHRRGTLRGMDAATRKYLRRVPRWWAGKGPAAKPQITRSTTGRNLASRKVQCPLGSCRLLY